MALKSKPLDKVRTDLPLHEVAEPVPVEPPVRVNINVPVQMRNRWKAEAGERRMSLQDLVIFAVDLAIKEGRKP